MESVVEDPEGDVSVQEAEQVPLECNVHRSTHHLTRPARLEPTMSVESNTKTYTNKVIEILNLLPIVYKSQIEITAALQTNNTVYYSNTNYLRLH